MITKLKIARGVPLIFYQQMIPKLEIARGGPLGCLQEVDPKLQNRKRVSP